MKNTVIQINQFLDKDNRMVVSIERFINKEQRRRTRFYHNVSKSSVFRFTEAAFVLAEVKNWFCLPRLAGLGWSLYAPSYTENYGGTPWFAVQSLRKGSSA